MHIEFGPVASFCLVFFGLIFAATTVALFGAIAFAVKKIEQQLEKLTNMAEPIVAKATNTLDTVQRITVNVGEKADNILTRGEALTETMSDKVERTSTVVQEAVTSPLINISSLITGLSTGLSVWGRAASGNAKSAGRTARRNGTPAADEDRVVVTSNAR